MDDTQPGECVTPDALALRMPAERSDSGAGRRAGLGRQAVAALRRLSRSRCRYHRSRRYFSRRIHLRIDAGLAAGAAARFFLRGSGDELHGAGRARRHSACGCDREPDGDGRRATKPHTTRPRWTEQRWRVETPAGIPSSIYNGGGSRAFDEPWRLPKPASHYGDIHGTDQDLESGAWTEHLQRFRPEPIRRQPGGRFGAHDA